MKSLRMLGIGFAIVAHVADAKVGADLCPGCGVDALAKDFELAIHERGGIVLALPHDEVLVIHAVVRHGRVKGAEIVAYAGIGFAIVTHVADAEVVGANLRVYRHRIHRTRQRLPINPDARL